ncbi:hypothetical protein Bbelb_379360 [Branchiostoma belcheri]|nr:hypothetical protein Bbelb_379360 [Branchiostoma belcheri]
MFGAGKRKIKLPARYAASPAEDDPEWLSTPTDNLAEQLDNEILDVSRRIEQMKVDMGLENRTESTSTPLPTHGDVIEHGLVTIDSTTTLSEVHKLKEEHLRRPPRNHNSIDGQAGHGHATPVERAGGSGSTYCYRFQANDCAFSADHIAASGTLHVHACKFCARHRPGVDAGHPAKFCPYNRDRGRQGNHAAARDTLA